MPAGGKVILVVEDNPDDEAMTLRALKSGQVTGEIVVARDGVAALDYLNGTGSHAGRDVTQLPQVVLLDLKLPKLDGIQVLERIRNTPATRHLPVVVLTSSDEERDLVRTYALGVNSYVRKPVDFKEFTEAVRMLGVYWLQINQTPPAV